jgi:hypothetical protein
MNHDATDGRPGSTGPYAERDLAQKGRRSGRPLLSWGLLVISCLFGILNILGRNVLAYDALTPSADAAGVAQTVGFALLGAVLFYIVALGAWHLFDSDLAPASLRKHWWMEGPTSSDRRFFWISVLVILACWLPWIVAYYPASMDNDVYFQLDSVLGYEEPSNHHPWVASLIITGFYSIGHALGSDNLGIFLFVIIRDIACVLIYAASATLLKRAGAPRWACVLTVVFFAVTPVWGAYAKHAFKDTFGAAIFCLYVVTLIGVVRKARTGAVPMRDCVVNALVGLAASLMRNNFIFAVIVGTLLVVWMFARHHERAAKSIVMVVIVAGYFALSALFTACGVKPTSSYEAFSIPLQQVARAVSDHADELTADELEYVDRYLLLEAVEAYDPIISDPVKSAVTERGAEDPAGEAQGLCNLWLTYAVRYPESYVEATLAQTCGYYAIVPPWPERAGNMNAGMCIWDWQGTSSFASEQFDFSYVEGTAGLRDALSSWAETWDHTPVLNLTDCIALYTWFTVVLLLWLARRKQWALIIPVIVVQMVILTAIASPVNGSFRYFAPAAASCPTLLALVTLVTKRLS